MFRKGRRTEGPLIAFPHPHPSQYIAAGQKACICPSLTYLIGALVAATVAALHGVASGHPHLSPHHHPGCGGSGFLHEKTAAAHRECRS